MLIEINILTPKDIDLIISTRTGYINSYYITFELIIAPPTRSFIKQNVMLKKTISIPAHSRMTVPVFHNDLPNNNYMFKPADEYPVTLFTTVINTSFHAVITRNNTNQPVHLPRRLQINSVMNLKIDEYYHIDDSKEAQKLTIKLPKQTHQSTWDKKAFAALADHLRPTRDNPTPLKTTLSNEVTVYESPDILTKLTTVVEEFSNL